MVRLYARGGGGVAPRSHNLTFWFTILHSETGEVGVGTGATRPARVCPALTSPAPRHPASISPGPLLRKSHI
jgi:hypothetical protein